jgi:hypothetical protein
VERREFLAMMARGAGAGVMARTLPRTTTVRGNLGIGLQLGPDDVATLVARERQVGRLGITRHYVGLMDAPLAGSLGGFLEGAVASGHIPHISIHASLHRDPSGNPVPSNYVSWASIAAGRHDPELAAWARAIRGLGVNPILSFHHEPENDVSYCGTPGEFVSAFRHVRDVMLGARIRGPWAVVLTGGTYADSQVSRWYPGDHYVHWFGIDAYNHAPEFGTWNDLSTMCGPALALAQARRKRVFVGETGCLEDPLQPTRKAQWIATAGAWAEANDVAGLCYTDATPVFNGRRMAFRLDSSHASLQAFKQVNSSSYWNRR